MGSVTGERRCLTDRDGRALRTAPGRCPRDRTPEHPTGFVSLPPRLTPATWAGSSGHHVLWNSKQTQEQTQTGTRCCTAAQLTGLRPRVCAPSDRSTILAPTTGKGDHFCATRNPAPHLLNSPVWKFPLFKKVEISSGNFPGNFPEISS